MLPAWRVRAASARGILGIHYCAASCGGVRRSWLAGQHSHIQDALNENTSLQGAGLWLLLELAVARQLLLLLGRWKLVLHISRGLLLLALGIASSMPFRNYAVILRRTLLGGWASLRSLLFVGQHRRVGGCIH
jgi:hypothetical protein